MVLGFILSFLLFVLNAIIGLLPTFSVDFGQGFDSLSYLLDFFKIANVLVPIPTVITILTLIFTIKNAKLIWYVITYIKNLF